MKGIKMSRSINVDRWTTLNKGQSLKVVNSDKGGNWITKKGFYMTCTEEFARRMINEGNAVEIL